jgi:cytochrome c oxidase assembly protein subunit 15
VKTKSVIFKLAAGASLLALIVVVLGAYVRLSHAGLGCPDWPGCYGKLIAPTAITDVSVANKAYPARPVESAKAWKEMVHRYLASTLGLLIIGLAALSWKKARQDLIEQKTGIQQQYRLPVFLIFLVMLQGALGMWTVTLLLKPAIVTLHLLTGMLTLALLWWITLKQRQIDHPELISDLHISGGLRFWALLALVLVYCQIALGGWTSTNYVALHCGTEFPTCHGQWWPNMDFRDGFRFWRGLGIDYEGGVLSAAAGTAVHVTHRIGALIVALVVGMFSLILIGKSETRRLGLVLLGILSLQISLGIMNVVLLLPLPVAVAHNMVAALLLLTMVTINFEFYRARFNLGFATHTRHQPISTKSPAGC